MQKEGFCYSFNPKKCEVCKGKCCTGESGYIWITPAEMITLANHLGINVDEFRLKYLDKFGTKFSIKEKIFKDGFACIFFNEMDLNCSVYDYRPKQCRTFPFWDYFKENYEELEEECIGVKRL
ncbi:putative [Fe-S] cluster-containing protein [Campylobacter blaseri]|uniref:Zinc/iron-chelating domain-containing protein n=1 Tax=Campylobacter blaseri TaxID=2042961 RepID=A0A2P8QYH3_9BACT|nr:YkgJ family cysteine cluster protein [Campylobacter blaseri]PSM51281.1 zinc/iron-chelating domain-containing protein [Campylobacter blaseri]PSM52425.1 zinc/iron-chelating domain-containing protein [Campylobacter blaseri]QKF86246.1 putative [Fe-S] cluster-containing protein [Campylobacter blaseri]